VADREENLAKGERAFEEVLKLATTEEGWAHSTEKDGVNIYRRYVEGSDIAMMKGIARLPASADKVLALTDNLSGRKEWDELLIDAEVLQVFDEHHRIAHLKFKSPSFGVSNRDFILAYSTKKNDDGTILVSAVSTEHPHGVEVKGFVRGEILSSGYYIKPISDNESECVYIVQLNPKGWVPTMVVNLVAVKQPLVLAKMKHALSK